MRIEADKIKIQQFMERIGKATHNSGRIYFTGGVSAVLIGWRTTTVDVDLKLDPEPPGIFDILPKLKDELDLNIELAAPDNFIPVLPGWRERSQFLSRHGKIDFYHYDFYSQALSKIERYHCKDKSDVGEMFERSLINRTKLFELYLEIEPGLKRYPSIEPESFRRRVELLTGKGN